MNCQEFLGRYSEYLDERMDLMEAARWRMHIGRCASCARYDRVLRSGLPLVRTLPRIEPSPDFHPRLQHRLFHLEDELKAARRSSGAGVALSLAVAGALAMLAWGPLLGPERPVDEELPPVEARTSPPPAEAPESAPSRVTVSGGAWLGASTTAWPGPDWWSSPTPSLGRRILPAFTPVQGSFVRTPDSYSPLIIAPPTWNTPGAAQPGAWSGRASTRE